MRIPYYQVDAFTDRLFGGNPAGVCPLEAWPDDDTLLAIAGENAKPGNAFLVPSAGEADFDLRVYTPTQEVSISGHTTLSAAFVVFTALEFTGDKVTFDGQAGHLTVTRDGDLLTLDFPALPAEPDGPLAEAAAALNAEPKALFTGLDWMAVFEHENEIRALAPDMGAVAALDCRGIMATAPGKDCNFVSRVFAPGAGIPEDQVTGSAHCMMAPYWSARLGKTRLEARQLSRRGGTLVCEDKGERVAVSGQAVLYAQGEIEV
jgi:PhzF family phenazine biosynthesis protein